MGDVIDHDLGGLIADLIVQLGALHLGQLTADLHPPVELPTLGGGVIGQGLGLPAPAADELAGRQTRYRSATQKLVEARRRINEEIEAGLKEVVDQRAAIFEHLGIEEDEELTVDTWLEQLPDFVKLGKELSEARTIRIVHEQALADNEHLLELQPVELEQQIEEQQDLAGRRDGLSEKISAIDRDIREAKRGHELSEALEGHDAATAQLTAARDENCEAVVGALLADWVRRTAIEKSRPAVFHRANELFVKFTRGRLQLELDDMAKQPSFLARSGTEAGRPVTELSTGERVQMLIAVRMAFFEQNEPSRLPLLLDEALGTSDDERAGIIIDTVVDIAREGRQVFYFTAQHDEVGKWVARLEDPGIEFKVIDLAQERQLAAGKASPLEIAHIEAPKPLDPAGMSYDEYGSALGVPGLDPTAENLDDLHLWHLLNDCDLLFQLLTNGVVTWGQLRTLVEHGGAGLVESEAVELDRGQVIARAVGAAYEAWQIGRGKPVDRGVLLDKKRVSVRFIDELSELAQQVQGNAQAIIEALEMGKVSGWRSKSTDRLREYLEENGFLTDIDPLQPEEIRVRIVGSVAEELRNGIIDLQQINRILGGLPQ